MVLVMNTAICVIGMHRSGTSAITKTISCLGIDLGNEDSLMEGAEDNPLGFWENRKITLMNDRILNKLQREWCSVLPLDEGWWKKPETEKLKKELTELIRAEYPDQKIWIWKDPRTTLLLPLWQEIMSELNIQLKYVVCVRNPNDVYKSLKKRDGFSPKRAMDLWSLYTLNALYWTRDRQRIIVRYEELIEDWENVLREVSDSLNLKWPNDTTKLKREIESFLKPELRHHVSSTEEIMKSVYLDDSMKQLYLALIHREVDDNETVERLYHELGNHQVYIWGAGSGGLHKLQELQEQGIDVKGFIDSDPKKQTELIHGKPVRSPACLLNNPEDVTPVVIGSMYYEEIRNQLFELGYTEESNYFMNNGLTIFVKVGHT